MDYFFSLSKTEKLFCWAAVEQEKKEQRERTMAIAEGRMPRLWPTTS
nr:MAG TPA: hypothetical protein [Caudoviricetes sp.]